MNKHVKTLLTNNPDVEELIEAFCQKDPGYMEAKQQFYETAHKIADIVGFDLYDDLERCFGIYLNCSNNIYYLFGLGLRQEILSALQPEMPQHADAHAQH